MKIKSLFKKKILMESPDAIMMSEKEVNRTWWEITEAIIGITAIFGLFYIALLVLTN